MSLVLDGLGHRFADQPWLFRGIHQAFLPGRVYALVGPSGSGKSTLLSILAGWMKPTEGQIDSAAVNRVGWVFQNPHGVARRTAVDHVALPFLARGASTDSADGSAQELLKRFGLAEVAQRKFQSLSGGEAQRLMLARGIAASPNLLLIDEPTAQLDPQTAGSVNEAIAECATAEVIVVVATHDPRTRDSCTDVLDLASYVPSPEPGSTRSSNSGLLRLPT